MNLTDARPVIRRQCIACGEMFEPVDGWVCPFCEAETVARRVTGDQARLEVGA